MAHKVGMSMLATRWSSLSLFAAATLLVAPAAAQDVPWGKKKDDKVQPAPRAPKQAPKPAAPKVAAPKPQAPKQQPPKQGASKQAPKQAPGGSGADARTRMKASPFPADAPKAKTAEPAPSAGDIDALKKALEPYGSWHEHPERGLVWIPDEKEVGKDFAPYKSDGRWGFSKAGDWTWVSDYAWGDIPFHFGNWTWLPPVPELDPKDPKAPKEPKAAPEAPQGWAWVPGFQHAPAWVVWRLGDGKSPFVGWAPMPPTESIVNGKVQPASGEQVLPFFYVPAAKLFASDVEGHVVTDRKLGRAVHNRTRVFDGSLGACAPERVKGKAPCDPKRMLEELWRPASPTLKQAGISAALIGEPPDSPTRLMDAVRALEKDKRAPKSKPATPRTDEKPVPDRRKGLRDDDDAGDERTADQRTVRRCVRTHRHGMRCWTYRWPPLWRGRR